MKFVFADGEKLGVYRNGAVERFESNYITHYRETAIRDSKSKEWKSQGQAARLMAEDYYFQGRDESVVATLRAVACTEDENKIVYAVSVNNSSGIYFKYLDDESKTEAHIISSNEVDFMSVAFAEDGSMLAAVQEDNVTAHIAVFQKDSGDYKLVTGGDSLDENPSFGAGNCILFNSYGVGRDLNNNFVAYMPSEIYRLHLNSLEVETLAANPKFSYLKPVSDAQGNIYAIKKPGTEKTRSNPLIEILMIPVRIVQGIVGFISSFVMCFSGKPLVEGQSGRDAMSDGSAARNGKADPKKLFINNNLINVDEELKKNKKQEDYGFIPSSWKLVRLACGNEPEKEIASSVGDYCLVEEEGGVTFLYTNGKHIFSVKEGEKRKKLVDTDCCLKVGAVFQEKESKEFFDFI